MASECRPVASQRAHPPPLPAATSGSCTHSHAAGRGAPHVLYAATTADAVILVIRIHLIGHRHGHPAQSGQNVCRAERPCHPQVRGASLEQDLPRGVPARWHRSGRRARAPEPASSSESATRRRTSLKLAFAPRAVQRDLAGWATGLHQGASSPGATRVCGLRTRGHLCPPRSTPQAPPNRQTGHEQEPPHLRERLHADRPADWQMPPTRFDFWREAECRRFGGSKNRSQNTIKIMHLK